MPISNTFACCTQANAKWAQAVNPHNQQLAERAKKVAKLRSKACAILWQPINR